MRIQQAKSILKSSKASILWYDISQPLNIDLQKIKIKIASHQKNSGYHPKILPTTLQYSATGHAKHQSCRLDFECNHPQTEQDHVQLIAIVRNFIYFYFNSKMNLWICISCFIPSRNQDGHIHCTSSTSWEIYSHDAAAKQSFIKQRPLQFEQSCCHSLCSQRMIYEDSDNNDGENDVTPIHP